MIRTCNICGTLLREAFRKRIQQAYEGVYMRCPACGFLHLPEHPWLDDPHQRGASEFDLGAPGRNIANAHRAHALMSVLGDAGSQECLDFGGGYGLFVRLMRDKGYDFRLFDPYGTNIFARGCETTLSLFKRGAVKKGYGMITLFEVMEHLPHPADIIRELYRHTDNIFFSTELQPEDASSLPGWHYLSTETGQHLSFFTRQTFAFIAECLGAQYTTDGHSHHLLSKRRVHPRLFRMLVGRRLPAAWWQLRKGRPSLLEADHARVLSEAGEISLAG